MTKKLNWYEVLQRWHDSRKGLLAFGILEAVLAYAFASWAIDSGSLIDYFLTIVLVIGAVQNFVRLGIKVIKGVR